MPTIVAFLTVVVGLVLNMGASDEVFFLLFLSSPLILSWLIFQGPLLVFATQKGYWRTLRLRLPHTWVVANLGMAGILAIATPLVNISIQLPLPCWTVVFWWGITVMCALVAIPLLLPYEMWSVRRGYQAWIVLTRGEGEVKSAPWKKVWWWILLSYVVLFCGVIGYAIIQQTLAN